MVVGEQNSLGGRKNLLKCLKNFFSNFSSCIVLSPKKKKSSSLKFHQFLRIYNVFFKKKKNLHRLLRSSRIRVQYLSTELFMNDVFTLIICMKITILLAVGEQISLGEHDESARIFKPEYIQIN